MARPPKRHSERRRRPCLAPTLLTGEDLFATIRSDEELHDLVASTARRSATPYCELVSALLGISELEPDRARALWTSFVDHRRLLASKLGRPVHLRVAALDWTLTRTTERARVVTAEVLADLVKRVTTDALTGAANREGFFSVLAYQIADGERRPFAVAMLDLDGFKQVNDREGHARGDVVLGNLVTAARQHLRPRDVIARLGGDEFAILFPESDREYASAILERIADSFANLCPEEVAFSAGLATYRSGDSVDSLLDRADQRMYSSKRRRKRRTRLSAWRAQPGAASAETVPRGRALYLTRDVDRFADLHRLFAARGHLLVPIPVAGDLPGAVRLLDPDAVFADAMAPPKGGAGALASLGDFTGQRWIVAPARWTLRTGDESVRVLRYPFQSIETRGIFHGALEATAPEVEPLGDDDVAAIFDAARALFGHGHRERMTDRVRERPEIDLLALHLGT